MQPPTTQALAKAKTLNQPLLGLSTIQAELYVQVDPDTETAAAAPNAIHTQDSAPLKAHSADPPVSGTPNKARGTTGRRASVRLRGVINKVAVGQINNRLRFSRFDVYHDNRILPFDPCLYYQKAIHDTQR